MAYLGRYQLGQTIPLYLNCHTAVNQLALPDLPPQLKVFDASKNLAEQHLMPIEDRYIVTGWFRYPLFLGRLYSVGYYSVVYYYTTGNKTYNGLDTDCFEVVGGGDVRGSVVGTYFYNRPEARYIVQGLESGSIIKGRNPTV